MIELNKIVTFRIPESEYEDLKYLVKGIQKLGKEKVIRNIKAKEMLDDIQEAKGRKGVNLSMADIIRLGCKLLLSKHEDVVRLVRAGDEMSNQYIKSGG
jgi:hypothetical protein|tara:strand:- start:190 stop:486 length:297 start_codon:yes stop_codon:yes gene_type:complete